jgi:hypothetical protein
MEPAERNLYRAQVVRERLVAAERETRENAIFIKEERPATDR